MDNIKNELSNSGDFQVRSKAEREVAGVDPRNEKIPHKGSDELAAKYNIDDQAHLDSSVDDFIMTTSKFRHADGSVKQNDQEI